MAVGLVTLSGGNMRRTFPWDRGLDPVKTYRRLLKDLEELRGKKGPRSFKRLAYTLVLLAQLRNGCRVSEAVEAVSRWAETGEREVSVRVRKQAKNPTLRTVVIPEELKRGDGLVVKAVLPISAAAVKMYCRRRYGFNTHSLRYAYITYMSEKGYPPQLIGKITGHRKLDHIQRYVQAKKAEEILRETRIA